MGCGGSVAENQHLKIAPSPLPPQDAPSSPVGLPKQDKDLPAANKAVDRTVPAGQNSAQITKK
jgi:hypothetical protein